MQNYPSNIQIKTIDKTGKGATIMAAPILEKYVKMTSQLLVYDIMTGVAKPALCMSRIL